MNELAELEQLEADRMVREMVEQERQGRLHEKAVKRRKIEKQNRKKSRRK